MPDSDLPSELPPELAAVVARWNPQGSALLRAVPADPGARAETDAAVVVFGPDDAGTALLRAELARLQPQLPLAGPIVDPTTLRVPPAVALILLDAGATVGAATLDLIQRLHTNESRIVFALNGFHAYADWREVVERDRALLARVLGGEPEIVPASAPMAAAARGSGDGALFDRAGVAALHARLTAAIGAPGGRVDYADVVAQVLAETRRRILDQAEQLTSGAALRQLREERATLLADRDGGRAQAMATLRNRLHLARMDLLHEVGARVRTLNTTARADLDRLGRREARAFPERLRHAVSELTAELDVVVGRRLAELTRQIAAVIGPAPAVPVPRTDPPPPIGPDPEPRHRGAEDHLMIALGASGGFGLGRLVVAPLSLVPALDYATVPVALLLGGGVAYWVVRVRGHLADRAHLRQWVNDALVNAKAQLEQRVATALVEAESELTDQVVRASTARVVAADRRIADLEAQLRQLQSQQPAQLAACNRDLAILDAH
ncbi:hypothetical protein NDR87_29075 [Nocardia sp. CDC159]|uniref:Dynamin family protein n=1 Tax=Nocardia pulmonis TaxID=2951408 RepID=A0A9X2J068_9NOCA|nr:MULTISPECIES: hypothetical protein [Nocardia]MCM6777459.1 hypothetical protein [Nocardia pulmonis]MCM6790434.1 hypothetical protein [Nocardia sp. CDC159]